MSTIYTGNYTCPFCGEKFSCRMQGSCYISGRNLDFMPFGAARVPAPVPVCPKCKFVLGRFTEEEIMTLKTKINQNNIFDIEPNMPDYYYLAKEYELLDEELDTIIHCYHSAIWQTSNKDLFFKISDIMMEYFKKVNKSNENYYNYKIIKLDFLRRRGEFEKASELLKEIYNEENFPFSEENNILLEYQEELIEKKDVDDHSWPNENRKEREIIKLRYIFFSKIKVLLYLVNNSIKIETIDELQQITGLKASKIFHKISNNLSIIDEGRSRFKKIIEVIEFLKEKKLEAILSINNNADNKNIKIHCDEINCNDFEEEIYRIFHER